MDQELLPVEKSFAYMPLMHSEELEDQELCVKLFKGDPTLKDNVAYAVDCSIEPNNLYEKECLAPDPVSHWPKFQHNYTNDGENLSETKIRLFFLGNSHYGGGSIE